MTHSAKIALPLLIGGALAACVALTPPPPPPALQKLMNDNTVLLRDAGRYRDAPADALGALALLRANALALNRVAVAAPPINQDRDWGRNWGRDWPLFVAEVDDYRCAIDRMMVAVSSGDTAGMVTGYQMLGAHCTACHDRFGGG